MGKLTCCRSSFTSAAEPVTRVAAPAHAGCAPAFEPSSSSRSALRRQGDQATDDEEMTEDHLLDRAGQIDITGCCERLTAPPAVTLRHPRWVCRHTLSVTWVLTGGVAASQT